MLGRELCIHLCPYYKPSKDAEIACKGFSVVEELLREGKKIVFEKSDRVINTATEEMLIKTLCLTCPFYEEDCDFISSRRDAKPCGGFTLLGNLLESGILTIDDIRKRIR